MSNWQEIEKKYLFTQYLCALDNLFPRKARFLSLGEKAERIFWIVGAGGRVAWGTPPSGGWPRSYRTIE